MTRKRSLKAATLAALVVLSVSATTLGIAGAGTVDTNSQAVDSSAGLQPDINVTEQLAFEPVPLTLNQSVEMLSGIKNTGDTEKTVQWTLTIGNTTVQTGNTTIGAGKTKEVETSFVLQGIEPGTYDATLTFTTDQGSVSTSTEVEIKQSAAGGPLQGAVEVEPNPATLNKQVEVRIEFTNSGDENKTVDWTLNMDTEGGDITKSGSLVVPAGGEAEAEFNISAETGSAGFFPVVVQATSEDGTQTLQTVLAVKQQGQELSLPIQYVAFEVEPNPVQPGGESEVRFEFNSTADADAVYEYRWVLPVEGGEDIVKTGTVEVPAEEAGEIEFSFTAPEGAKVYESRLTLSAFGINETFTRKVGVGVDSVETTTPTPTPTATSPPTPEQEGTPTETEMSPTLSPTDTTSPGFGLVVALVALAAAGLLRRRR